MSNEYKQTLARFEAAVRAHEMKGSRMPQEHAEIEHEYQQSKQALVRKLQYRTLAAEERVRLELNKDG